MHVCFDVTLSRDAKSFNVIFYCFDKLINNLCKYCIDLDWRSKFYNFLVKIRNVQTLVRVVAGVVLLLTKSLNQ